MMFNKVLCVRREFPNFEIIYAIQASKSKNNDGRVISSSMLSDIPSRAMCRSLELVSVMSSKSVEILDKVYVELSCHSRKVLKTNEEIKRDIS